MKYKMENPNKVMNIVEGNYEALKEIYTPFLKELEKEEIISFIGDEEIKVKFKVK